MIDPATAAFTSGLFSSPFGRPQSKSDAAPYPGVLGAPADQENRSRHLERHGTPTHTGYPFMQLAKATGTDYGDVLIYVEWYQDGAPWDYGKGPLGTPQQIEALQRLSTQTVRRIDALLHLPISQRGGDHYPDVAP